MRKFIVVEGADGSGKSTLVGKLATWLTDYREKKVWISAEPTKSLIGSVIHDLLSKKTSVAMSKNEFAAFMKHLMIADRIHHIGSEFYQSDKDFFLCDRYYPSTLVYQTAHIEGDDEALGHMINLRKLMDQDIVDEHGDWESLHRPDLIVYLGLPETCDDMVAQRMGKRGRPGEIYEDMVFQRRIRRRYELWFAEGERGDHRTSVAYIDARFDADKVAEDVIDHVMKLGWA
jgi:dTMP kinase